MSEVTERKSARRKFHIARWVVLVAVLALSTTIGLLHQKAPELRLAGVDALCPFGGVESLWALIASGGMLNKIAGASFILLGAAVLLNLLFGRAFCGHFCPLGTLQDLPAALRRRLGLSRREIPKAVDVPARFLKYLVFGVFAWLAWLTGSLAIRPYDPWVAYHHLTSPELLTNFGIGAAVLGVSLVGSLFYDRFFCKYLCPMGAFLGLFSKLGLYQVTRHVDACIDCGACDTVCPVNIAVATVPATVSDAECLACGECVAACPKAEALKIETRTGRVITPLALVGATVAFMVAVIGVSVAAGGMSFFNKPLAEQVGAGQGAGNGGNGQGQGQGNGAALATAATATVTTAAVTTAASPAQFDTSLIKGYMTIAEIAPAAGIPTEEFIATFGITEAELTLPLKEMKNTHPFDTQAVRDFVADRMGVPRSEPDSCE